MTILIADDDAGYRYPIVRLFQDYGYNVEEAIDLPGVLAGAPKSDIWIIDVRLPSGKMEGILAVKELADQGIYSKYPVIFISVIPESFAVNELSPLKNRRPKSVRYRWVEKNFELQVLLNIVKRLVKDKK